MKFRDSGKYRLLVGQYPKNVNSKKRNIEKQQNPLRILEIMILFLDFLEFAIFRLKIFFYFWTSRL